MTWRDLQSAAQISYEGLRGIRRGDRSPSGLTARRLEDALRWRHGSIAAVLDGDEPTALPADEPEPKWNLLLQARQLREIADDMERRAWEDTRGA